jgi:hypothetical protein
VFPESASVPFLRNIFAVPGKTAGWARGTYRY